MLLYTYITVVNLFVIVVFSFKIKQSYLTSSQYEVFLTGVKTRPRQCPKIKSDMTDSVWINIPEKQSKTLDVMQTIKMANSSFYRPRSALARALYEKQRNDHILQELDKNEWYQVDKQQLPPELQEKFVQLTPDDETKDFLARSIEKCTWLWTQIWYMLAKAVLKHFWSITDINGWLGRGSMFVLSNAQARALLRVKAGTEPDGGSMVDIGAGDGEVSRRFNNLFAIRYATEISGNMRKVLSSKGYIILDTEDWWKSPHFSCVCMLNLLDRCRHPRSMLSQARSALRPDGTLFIALVLPYKPYVEVTPDHKPDQRLPIKGITFEEQVTSFVEFMKTMGFQLFSWARAPYLCEGDLSQSYYWLDDSVFVFKPMDIDS